MRSRASWSSTSVASTLPKRNRTWGMAVMSDSKSAPRLSRSPGLRPGSPEPRCTSCPYVPICTPVSTISGWCWASPSASSISSATARELRELGEAKAAAYRASRVGQPADGVVTGRQQGRLELMTEDYLSVYLDTDQWDGRPRFEVTVN